MFNARLGANRERGFAVVTVLFVIGILLLLGSALTIMAVANSENTIGADNRERAYNTSESGIADVLTGLGNSTITSTKNATWVNGNSFASAQDTNATYDYNVTFNNALHSQLSVANPLTSTGGACGAPSNPGAGCVGLPPISVLIAVKGHYNGREVDTEAVAVENDIALNGNTLVTKGDALTNGNSGIAADPCSTDGVGCPSGVSPTHNVSAFADGNFTGGKGIVDGSVTAAGSATATTPAGCTTCAVTASATPIPFPASNNIVQKENQWKHSAVLGDTYVGPTAVLPKSITVNPGQVWFIDQPIDLFHLPIVNNGGLIVVTGQVQETGNLSGSNYSLGSTCLASCACHSQAQIIGLSSLGVQMHGQGTGAGNPISQGVIVAPNGPGLVTGNGVMQSAIVAASAQIGGSSGLIADTCAAQAVIPLPGYNITGFGQD